MGDRKDLAMLERLAGRLTKTTQLPEVSMIQEY